MYGAFDIVELRGASLKRTSIPELDYLSRESGASSFTDGEFGYIVSGTSRDSNGNGKMGRFDLETMKQVTKG